MIPEPCLCGCEDCPQCHPERFTAPRPRRSMYAASHPDALYAWEDDCDEEPEDEYNTAEDAAEE